VADNRIARGIVLVPCLLRGGAFLATAAGGQGAAADNRGLAIAIGAALLGAGLLSQLPSSDEQVTKPDDDNTSP